MTDYSKFRKSADMIDWMRTAQAEHFAKQLAVQVYDAHKELLALCAKSSDPKVTSAVTRWSELNALTTFLVNSRKESTGE